ncbi:GatB/YqeY domain-containing protein [Aeromicrobium sp. Leaf350]|uniref:GatB/YqeY domain-containing protein n=1 Tax=Aeromicrobium sp. Leaf350 TaxID=2876565 RepID=UPI001E41C6BC|nr:GatB/YqeY domain-containing protein [Aeromicrobium sp. Leaf350]
MSALKERLRSDLTTALKAREALTASTIRLVLAAVSTAEVAGKEARELSDEEVLDIVVKEAKKRRESATAFDDGGRPELAQKERDEAEILATYLPSALSDEEVAAIVTAAIEQTGAAGEGLKSMGKVMGLVQPQVKGRADGGAVAAEVKRQLGA